MGANNSAEKRKASEAIWTECERKALINYHQRLKQYNHLQHGDFTYYKLLVQTQFELECIPEHLRSGLN